MLQIAIMAVFPSLMAYAAVSDLLTMTIANWVSLALTGCFVLIAVASGMPLGDLLANHIACGACVLVVTFGLFAFGWIGGGDAKLAASTAVWLGWDHIVDYGVEASAIGGALTLAIVVWRKVDMPRALMEQGWVARLHSAANGVPYGIALAATGLLLYPETAVWSAALLQA